MFPSDDYATLLAASKNCASALEFGPGVSTEAFIAARVPQIVTCEHVDKWYNVAVERFKDYPQVTVLHYLNIPEVTVAGFHYGWKFDLGFVDSPVGGKGRNRIRLEGQEDCSRLNTLLFALKHCDKVYLHDTSRKEEQSSLKRTKSLGWKIEELCSRRGLALLTKE